MNIDNLKNKNIHFVECENWHDVYGYEKSQMKEDTINYIEQLQQENKILKENAEHNDKVVDKVNWENMLLKKENKQLKDNCNKLNFIKNRKNQGASQENVNKMIIEFVNSWLNEVSE